MVIAEVKKVIKWCCVVAGTTITTGWGQSYGTVNLPVQLADANTPVTRSAIATPVLNKWAEGPVVAPNGTLFFSEQLTGTIWKVSAAGAMTRLVTVTIGNSGYVNGMDFNPVSGNLVVCERARITERDTADGQMIKVITSGTTWGQGANDLTFAANGDLFFTCFNQSVYFHSNDSSVNYDWNFGVSSGSNWNGIEYIEEKGVMYLCQYGQNRILSFKVDPVSHQIDTSSKKTFAVLPSPDGITVDSLYNVYVACNSTSGPYSESIVVYDSTGTVLGAIHLIQSLPATSSNTTNCVFGNFPFGSSKNSRTLYITGDSGTFTVELKVPGRVRPRESPVIQGQRAFTDAGGGEVLAPFTIVRSSQGLRINAGLQGNSLITIFSASGRRCRTFSVSPQSVVNWRPPASGMFMVSMSSHGVLLKQVTVFGY